MKNSNPFKLVTLLCATVSLLILTESTRPPFSCDSSDPSTTSYPFCNTTIPINQRVQDLIQRLTLDEKVSQLVNTAPAIQRLGIASHEWWSEALHGVAIVQEPPGGLPVTEMLPQGFDFNGTKLKSATSFPQVILTAAAFDSHLWYRIAKAIGVEARGFYSVGQARGMAMFAPNVNIFRDPRWGRGQETPGEDPFVAAKYGVAFVRGIQGDSFEGGKLGEHLQASACCKHVTAYDLEKWNGVHRFKFDAQVTKQDLADTYQPPFKSCIEEGNATGLMCSYNLVNGVSNCANHNLLTKTARGEWGLNGYITSDCFGVKIIHLAQKYAKTAEEVVAAVLKAGVDLNCGVYLAKYAKSAVEKKLLAESEIDRAVRNLFTVRMRLGLFDGNPSKLPFGGIGPDKVCSKEHRDLALEAARNGIVLLKNSGNLLPLSKDSTISLAVIGPNANSPETLLGNYNGYPCETFTPLQGLQSYVKDTRYHKGCNAVNCTDTEIDEAVETAKEVDYVVFVMGLDQTQEREEYDRVDLTLPGKQQELINSVARAAKKPVVLVILSGGPVDISFAKNDPKIGSILWAGYPGEAGGIALAEIIFGDHNPGGRLPMTWYPQSFTRIPMTDMRMRPDEESDYPGRSYRFYNGPTVFEFGYGLSYSNYAYEFISIPNDKLYINQPESSQTLCSNRYKLVSDIRDCETNKFLIKVKVMNHGEMAGKHPVLLFMRHEKHINERPIKQLVRFQSLNLNPGEEGEVEFVLSPCEHLSRANEDGEMIIEEGLIFLVVGDEEYPITIIF